MSPSFALAGLVVGVVVGLTSTGGGALLTPALIFLGVPPSAAVGSDVLIASGMKLFGGGAYALRREVHWPTVGRLASGSLPGAVLGLWVLRQLPPHALDSFVLNALGVVLVLAGGASLYRALRTDRPSTRATVPNWPTTAALGFAIGALVATTSVGSGSILLCVMVVLFPLKPSTMVGSDLVHALLLSVVATIGHFAAGRVDFGLAGMVLLGGIPGVLLGAKLAASVPQRALRAGLAVALVIIGVSMVVKPVNRPPPTLVATAHEVAR